MMPVEVNQPGEMRSGDLFEDCRYHRCVCIEGGSADDADGVYGISLVDGTPCGCSIWHCGRRKLTIKEVVHLKYHGPSDAEIPREYRWWERP
jgi:hypothetical protein